MKNTIIAFALVAASLFANAQKTEKQTLSIKTNIYCSHCMQCGSCGPRINDHIREHNKGISNVKLDTKTNIITVTYDPAKTDPAKIRAAINLAGFDADDKLAPAEAVNKLDGCCRKN